MKKPVIPDPPESFGQKVLHDQMQKVLTFKASMSGFAGLAFNIFKGHPAVLIGNDIFFAEHAAV